VLIGILTNEKSFDILEKVQPAEKPVKIMLIGPNGAGKTTTIAKVAKLLMDNKYKVVFAAADTFRAAAIEQMGVHAERLGVKIIKRDYGSDPTSVAYDAVNYAKAHAIDVVLIDTAGRQDTNISLINEVKKMSRVIQPDLKIYIGESIAGNAIIEQITTFNKEIGIDAVILTKLDCDPKGGTMLSINHATGIPIIYVGIGQKYDDLEKFVPEKIVGNIVG
jgi:fused signal recognition particle receptor